MNIQTPAPNRSGFGIGDSVLRTEDPKLLRGEGRYTDDINLPRQAYAYVVRSTIAHGRIKSIGTQAAKAMKGVLGIYTGEDMKIAFNAKLMAAEKATVADVVTQVANYRQNVRAFDSKTLVTLMVGMYDIKNAFEAYELAGSTAAALNTAKDQLAASAIRLGLLVNDITAEGRGGRVVYTTVPDIGYSPYAIAKGVASQQVLHDLTRIFNDKFELTVTNDGRYAGLVFPTAETTLRNMADLTITSLTDVSTPACKSTAVLPTCDTKTLTDSVAATDGSGTISDGSTSTIVSAAGVPASSGA